MESDPNFRRLAISFLNSRLPPPQAQTVGSEHASEYVNIESESKSEAVEFVTTPELLPIIPP